MTREQVTEILKDNRDMVINFHNEKCKVDKFYTLKWFMTRVLERAVSSWARRVNIGEKEINQVINGVAKDYPQIMIGYKSNWDKAVAYFGYEHAKMIANAH